jgi:hypothetical protein
VNQQYRVQLPNSADSVFLWGAMAEVGDVMTDYIATTTAAVSVGPVSGLPRLDYLGSSCPRLLLEPQRTNDLQFSEQPDNAYWTKDGATISVNATASPSGYVDADKLQEDSSTGLHRYGKATFPSGTQRTFSVFAKKGERDYVSLFENNAVGAQVKGVIFNLNTGTLSLNNDPALYINPTITDYGNGWYRCSATWTPAALSVPSVGVSADGLTNSYAGTTGSGIFVWGAQLEAGAYATSYIPTYGAAVTRLADSAYKTGISSLLGATEGVVFLEVGDIQNNALTGAEVWYFEMRKDQNNSFGLASGGSSPQPIRFVTKIAGTAVTETEPAPFPNSKIAIKYTSTQFKLFRNGTLLYTTNKSIGNYADIQFMEGAGLVLSMILKQFLVFPTALSDADCIALTA